MDDYKVPSPEIAQQYSFSKEEKEQNKHMKEKLIIGNPMQVRKQIESLQKQYSADEMMVVTITHDEEAKCTSYRLLKEALG